MHYDMFIMIFTAILWFSGLGQPEEISCFRYPDRPTFFSKKAKKKKKGGGGGGGGGVFRWLVAATPFFFATPVSSKEGWAWPRHSTPTDRPAVERDSRDTGNKVFLLVGLSYTEHLL